MSNPRWPATYRRKKVERAPEIPGIGSSGSETFAWSGCAKPLNWRLSSMNSSLTTIPGREEPTASSPSRPIRRRNLSPLHSSDSPTQGPLLMFVEQLHQDGYAVFDLTAGADPFKDRFAASYDSVHSLSIYFKRGKWIRHKDKHQGEALARRALRSFCIAPNSAVEHVKQVARVPLGNWPTVLVQRSRALLRRSLSEPKLRIYVLE